MLFWILSTAFVVATLSVILLPLWRKVRPSQSEASFDVAIYKRQLTELEHDLETGLISEDQAKAARAEIARRLLAADEKVTEMGSGDASEGVSGANRIVVAVVVALVIPGIAYSIYVKNGVPGLEDQPYLGRCDDVPQDPHTSAEVNAVIDCLALRMEDSPDAEGLSLLARSYLTQNRFEEAANSYAKAIELAGPKVALLEGLGLAVIFANDGAVTSVARDAFILALEDDPASEWSRFYLAESEFQQGQVSEAVRAWIDLLEDTKGNERFREMVDGRIRNGLASIAESEGLDPGNMSVNPTVPNLALSGISGEQKKMIQGMVDGLAAKLADDPKNLDGWLKLIRSYVVLGEEANARKALESGTLAFLSDPVALKQIMDLGEELNLTAGPQFDISDFVPPEEAAVSTE